MNGYSPKDIALAVGETKAYGASLTDTVISREYGVSAGGSQHIRVTVIATALTVGAGVTVILQHVIGDTWVSLTSANAVKSVTATGAVSMTMMAERAADQAELPLGSKIRVVLTTGVGSAITVSRIEALQEL